MDRLVITLFFCVETFSRSVLLAIIPLNLLEHFGNIQRVTLFYAAVAIFGLGNSVLVPLLLHRLGVRLIIAAAGVFMTLAAILLATETPLGMALGLVVRVFASACVEIPMMAYIMDRIPRHRLGAFEPTRIFFQGSCIAVAPWLGFQLGEYVNAKTPFIVSGIGGTIMLCLALMALPVLKPETRSTALQRRPIDTVRRFFDQPRLRLAWLLALARSSFWVIFYIYAPILSVICGWSQSAGAAMLSLGSATLFFVAIWGRLARSFGARRVLIVGYALTGACLMLTAAAAVWAPGIAPLLLLSAAFAASIIDGPGNILFLRATRPHERPAMAGIYMTYRDVSQFSPVAVFSLILTVSSLASAFLVFAGVFFGAARLSQLIHQRLR
jgi:ACDE family multidrug resistance protein